MKRSRAFSQALVDKDMVTIFKKDPLLGRDSQVLVECHNGVRNLGALPIRLKTCCYLGNIPFFLLPGEIPTQLCIG